MSLCQTAPIALGNTNDIFNKTIVDSFYQFETSDAPSCFNDTVTSNPPSGSSIDGEPCSEFPTSLSCPGNYYEVVMNSSFSAVFLRKVSTVLSFKCNIENKTCSGCNKSNRCATQFDVWRIFVQLDTTLTRIIKSFNPKIGIQCKCRFPTSKSVIL